MLASAVEPERSDVRRHVAPAGRLETLGPAGVLDERARAGLAQKTIARPVPGAPVSASRQRQQDAGTVAGDAVGGPRTTVADGCQPRERPVEQLPRRAPARVGDEPDAARIALAGWVVQESLPVGQRCSPPFGRCRSRDARRQMIGEVPSRLRYELVRRGGRSETPASAWRRRERGDKRRNEFPDSVRAVHRSAQGSESGQTRRKACSRSNYPRNSRRN